MMRDGSRRLPLDRLNMLLSVRDNPEFIDLIAEQEAISVDKALYGQNPEEREEARQLLLTVRAVRNILDAKILFFQEEVRNQPQQGS